MPGATCDRPAGFAVARRVRSRRLSAARTSAGGAVARPLHGPARSDNARRGFSNSKGCRSSQGIKSSGLAGILYAGLRDGGRFEGGARETVSKVGALR
jgi:hypothetical protein